MSDNNDKNKDSLLIHKGHKGWHSRGYLPHFDNPKGLQSITFHLWDSVPAEVLDSWKQELRICENMSQTDPAMIILRKRIEKYADQGYGSCYLRQHRIAQIVQDGILHFDAIRYHIIAWTIMPNHVHTLIGMIRGYPLGDILHSWKSYTSKEANRELSRKGTFRMADYFDRFIRDEDHFHAVVDYIENNPVKARLVKRAVDWPFGSAWCREHQVR